MKIFIRIQSFALALVAIAILSAPADASVLGRTVGSSTSTDSVGRLDTRGNSVYFIPLSSSRTGVYGVTNVGRGRTAGTRSDRGYGTGYSNATALSMFIRYDLSSENVPSSNTELTFEFQDLDLVGINDPYGFFESLRFSYFDDTGTEISLTDTITSLADGFQYVADGVSASFSNPSSTNDPLFLTFSGSGLTDIINDIADEGGVYDDEFYLNVHFGSRSYRSAKNTAEKVISSALTASSSVPEPTALVIWSILGLGCVTQFRRR